MTDRPGYFRQGFAIFVGVFMFLLVAFTLEKTGLERGYILTLTACASSVLWIVCVIPASTTTASRFFLAARSNRSTINALAIMAALTFPLLLVESGALFFANPSFLVVILVAITIGVALSSILVGRYFRETGAIDLSMFLMRRFDASLPARSLAVALGLSGLLLLICGISLLFQIITWFFGIDEIPTLSIVALLVCFTAILGGANSNSRLAAISALLLLTAINLPLLLNSLSYANFPIGHLSFGSDALSEMWDLEDQLASLQIPILADALSPSSPVLTLTGGQQIIAGLVIIGSILFFPPLLQQHVTALSTGDAANGSQKVILLVGFFGASLVAFLAFTKFGFYQTLLGLSVSDARNAAPVLYSWGDRTTDFITLCGSVPDSVSSLLTSCEDGGDHVLTVQDISLNSDLILAGSPDLTALPFAFTAFLTSAIIISGIAFCSMLALATAKNITSAFYGSTQGSVASKQIFQTRFIVVIMVLLASSYVHYYAFDPAATFFLALSILASVLMPTMMTALFLPHAKSIHVTSAIFTGFVVAILYFVLSKYGIDFVAGTNDEIKITIPGMQTPVLPEFSAMFAVPASFVILAIGVLISIMQAPKVSQSVEDD